mgnify:CR=1 FL=1
MSKASESSKGEQVTTDQVVGNASKAVGVTGFVLKAIVSGARPNVAPAMSNRSIEAIQDEYDRAVKAGVGPLDAQARIDQKKVENSSKANGAGPITSTLSLASPLALEQAQDAGYKAGYAAGVSDGRDQVLDEQPPICSPKLAFAIADAEIARGMYAAIRKAADTYLRGVLAQMAAETDDDTEQAG